MRYIELFGGIGGFGCGIEKATENNESRAIKRGETPARHSLQPNGISTNNTTGDSRKYTTSFKDTSSKCVYYSKIDKYAVQTYNKNFGTEWKPTDIRKVPAESVPDHDVLCAGFPCQSFSIAGKRKGFVNTRGTLFFEICRIAQAKRPKILFLENVKGLLSHDNGRTFATILQSLYELGYWVEWQVLNSKYYGVPQNRERVFIIGHLGGEPRQKVFPLGESNRKDAIQIKRVGHMKGFRRYNQTYDRTGIVESLDTSGGGGHQPCVIGMVNQTCMKRNFETPKEINQYLKDSKGVFTLQELSDCLKLPKTQVEHYFRTDKSRAIPTPEIWLKLKSLLPLDDRYDKQINDFYEKEIEFEQTRRVWDADKMSPTLNATQEPMIVHNLQPRTGNPNEGGTGHLSKEDGTVYNMDTGNTQAIECTTLYGFEHGTHKHFNEILPKKLGLIRRLTPIECERLQGFPDNWTEGVSDTQRYKQLGNAVTTNVIEAITRNIFKLKHFK